MGESLKSKYKPNNPKKYKGDYNNIICRSSWERKFCSWCDMNESVLEWGSEEIWIPYRSPVDSNFHRYFPDFVMNVNESTVEITSSVIEVKPKKQTKEPRIPKKKTKSWLYEMKTYTVNQAKWKAAKEFCGDRKIEFKIITEKELGIR